MRTETICYAPDNFGGSSSLPEDETLPVVEITHYRAAEHVYGVASSEVDIARVGPPNLWVIRGNRAAIIDTGGGEESEREAIYGALATLGNPHVAAIIPTHGHWDHTGGINDFFQKTNAKIVPASYTRFVDSDTKPRVKETARLDLGRGVILDIIPTPGHTKDSISIFDRKNGILFTGDTVLGDLDSVAVGLMGMGDYMQSLQLLSQIEASVICPGHGSLVTDPKEKIQRMIEHRLEREEEILDLLRKGIKVVERLAEEIYPPEQQSAGGYQIESHLIYLQQQEKVKELSSGEYVLL